MNKRYYISDQADLSGLTDDQLIQYNEWYYSDPAKCPFELEDIEFELRRRELPIAIPKVEEDEEISFDKGDGEFDIPEIDFAENDKPDFGEDIEPGMNAEEMEKFIKENAEKEEEASKYIEEVKSAREQEQLENNALKEKLFRIYIEHMYDPITDDMMLTVTQCILRGIIDYGFIKNHEHLAIVNRHILEYIINKKVGQIENEELRQNIYDLIIDDYAFKTCKGDYASCAKYKYIYEVTERDSFGPVAALLYDPDGNIVATL